MAINLMNDNRPHCENIWFHMNVKFNQNITVETDRLILRPVSEEYKFDICNEFTPEVTKFMPFMPNGDMKVTEEFIAF